MSNTEIWSELNWTADIAWTIGRVNVTLQLYNYALGGYPTGGNGCVTYVSDAAPNIDETKNQTIHVNPSRFKNGTGHWRMKITGVAEVNVPFDFKADFIELNASKNNGIRFTIKNRGSLTAHIVSLWIINSTVHKHYSINLFVNSGETLLYLHSESNLLDEQYVAKVVTERGNIAVYMYP
jgi:hypothetical protein